MKAMRPVPVALVLAAPLLATIVAVSRRPAVGPILWRTLDRTPAPVLIELVGEPALM